MWLTISIRVLALATAVTSAVIVPRQSPTTIATLPDSAWIENIVVRSSGQVLLNRLDTPELWSLDPITKQTTKLLSFSGAQGLTGITEVAPDIFAVISGNATVKGAISIKSGTWGVWKVDLTGSAPKATLVKVVPESGFFIGITPLNNDTVFIADAGKGSIYKFSLSTGQYSIAVSDASLTAPTGSLIEEGVHGLKYHDGYLYYTNTFGNGFGKIKVDPATGATNGAIIKSSGSFQAPEDFAIGPDGSAYIAQLSGGNVIKVTSEGQSSTVARVSSCSSCAFGRTDKDKNTLYISTSGGAVLSVPVS